MPGRGDRVGPTRGQPIKAVPPWRGDRPGCRSAARRFEEQAKANAEASIEAANNVLVLLEGQVARGYIQLRGARALTASHQQNVRTA